MPSAYCSMVPVGLTAMVTIRTFKLSSSSLTINLVPPIRNAILERWIAF